jgi:plasmid stabilization system protein ParE
MRVRWTEPAVQDFTHICDYIDKHSSQGQAVEILRILHGARN